jgi:hypothetical protein
MHTLLGIIALVTAVWIYNAVPGHAWIGVGIVIAVLATIAAGVVFIALMYKLFIKVALPPKD